MSNHDNRRPHVFIPRSPMNAQPEQPTAPRRPVSPPNPFNRQNTSTASRSPQLSPLRRQPSPMTLPSRPRIQSAPDHYSTASSISFPEPQFYRSTSASHREGLSPPSNRSTHRLSSNTYNLNSNDTHTNLSVASFGSSYAGDDHYGLGSPEVCSPISSLLSSNSSVVRRCPRKFTTQIVCIIFICSSAIVTFFIASFIAWMPKKRCLVFKPESSMKATRNGIS